MHNKHRRTRPFWASFGISLLVLALPVALTSLYLISGPSYQDSGTPPVLEEESAPPLSLLLAVGEERQSPELFVLIRFDCGENAILLAPIPPETMVEDGGRFDALALVFKREGGRRGAAALSAALDIPVDRWLRLTPPGLQSVVDAFGAIDYALPEPLILPDGAVMLPGGRQVLDGRKVCAAALHKGFSGGEPQRLSLAGELLCAVLAQRAPLMSAPVAEVVFQTAVNAGSGTLTVADFESRRNALSGPDVRTLILSGEYNSAGNTFLLSSGSAAALAEEFGQ